MYRKIYQYVQNCLINKNINISKIRANYFGSVYILFGAFTAFTENQLSVPCKIKNRAEP